MGAFLKDFEVTEINKNITTASDYHRTLYTHCAFSFLIYKYRHASGKSQLPNGAFKLFAIVFMTCSNCCIAPAVPWNIDTVMSPVEQLTSVRSHWSQTAPEHRVAWAQAVTPYTATGIHKSEQEHEINHKQPGRTGTTASRTSGSRLTIHKQQQVKLRFYKLVHF